MARRKLLNEEKEEVKAPISDWIESYGELKDDESKLKKSIAEINTNIKDYMRKLIGKDEEKTSLSSDNFTATLKLRDDSKMNEDKLIAYLKKNKLAKGIVKKREYIDEKAFEEAVYNGLISDEQLAEMESCKDIKITEVLTISKIKKEKK